MQAAECRGRCKLNLLTLRDLSQRVSYPIVTQYVPHPPPAVHAAWQVIPREAK
jgi:hypothetical protein